MSTALDRLEIRELIQAWAILRDAGEWQRLAKLWHEDGWMVTTWSNSSAAEFIDRSRAAFDRGVEVQHTLGGSLIDITNDRAVAQTKMEILQRAPVHGVVVDVECKGRFIDAYERRAGRWGLLFRQPVYELDRMMPVDPAGTVVLDPALLATFPMGYRHLAYLQTHMGMTVFSNLPGTRGPEIEALQRNLAAWLEDAEMNLIVDLPQE